jgi:hypothetical protein
MNQQIAAILPAGAGVVGVAGAAAPFTYTITINWAEAGGDTPSYTLTLQI